MSEIETEVKTCICPVCGQVFMFDPEDLHIVDIHSQKYMLCSTRCYDDVMKWVREHNYEKVKDTFKL